MAMEFSEALQLAGPLIAAAGLISGVWYRMESKVEKVKTDADVAFGNVGHHPHH